MSIRLNVDELEVTTFAVAPGGGEPLAPEASGGPCGSQTCTLCPVEFTDGCGSYVGNCTSPGYNC